MHDYKIVEEGLPLKQASKAMIMLHGRGSNPFDILNLSRKLCDDTFYIAAPQANNNIWYPYSFLEDEETNEPWVTSAVGIINKLIDEISQTISKDHIYIMGFSQGACLALEATARHAEKLGGVIAFSGGLIGKQLNQKKYHGNFKGTKIFIGNSDNDPYIPLLRCTQSKELLEKQGADVTLKIYPGMDHTISKEEIQFVKTNIIGN